MLTVAFDSPLPRLAPVLQVVAGATGFVRAFILSPERSPLRLLKQMAVRVCCALESLRARSLTPRQPAEVQKPKAASKSKPRALADADDDDPFKAVVSKLRVRRCLQSPCCFAIAD